MFQRRLAIPFWTMAFFTVALVAPPRASLLPTSTTLLIMALAAIAVLVAGTPGAFPWLHPSRSLARARSRQTQQMHELGSKARW